jgi:AraC family transcriptional regulator
MASQYSVGTQNIEARASFEFGHAQVVRRLWDQPIDVIGAQPQHHLEFATLPRSRHARGCFPGDSRTERRHHRSDPIGEVFFLPAGRVVHATSHCRHQYSIICTFQPDAAAMWLEGDLTWTHARQKASLDITHPDIRGLLSQLGHELLHPGLAGNTMAELMAAQAGIQLARYLVGIGEPSRTRGLSTVNLRRIDERVAENGAPPSLTELATLCGLSVRHLTRGFRKSRQRSIGVYIAECRIQRARELLTAGSSIKSIAYTMGFVTPAAFSTSFRRATGERPRDYAQRRL